MVSLRSSPWVTPLHLRMACYISSEAIAAAGKASAEGRVRSARPRLRNLQCQQDSCPRRVSPLRRKAQLLQCKHGRRVTYFEPELAQMFWARRCSRAAVDPFMVLNMIRPLRLRW